MGILSPKAAGSVPLALGEGGREGGRGEIPARKRESARKREGGGGGGASPPPSACEVPVSGPPQNGFLVRTEAWGLLGTLGIPWDTFPSNASPHHHRQHPCVRHHHRYCRRRRHPLLWPIRLVVVKPQQWRLPARPNARPRTSVEEGRRRDFMPASGLARSPARPPSLSRPSCSGRTESPCPLSSASPRLRRFWPNREAGPPFFPFLFSPTVKIRRKTTTLMQAPSQI